MPKEVTAAEIARRLGVDKATVTRWLKAGKLRGWQTPGGHWRVEESEVERVRKGSNADCGRITDHDIQRKVRIQAGRAR